MKRSIVQAKQKFLSSLRDPIIPLPLVPVWKPPRYPEGSTTAERVKIALNAMTEVSLKGLHELLFSPDENVKLRTIELVLKRVAPEELKSPDPMEGYTVEQLVAVICGDSGSGQGSLSVHTKSRIVKTSEIKALGNGNSEAGPGAQTQS